MSSAEIMQRTIDLYQAQIAANNGQVDLVALKRSVTLALGWPTDVDLDKLPPRISRALERAVDVALLKHGLDRLLDDIAD
jgi:hypothetical protein